MPARMVQSSTEVICPVPFASTLSSILEISTNGYNFFNATAVAISLPSLISDLSPSFGPASGGTLLTLIGANFVPGSYAHFSLPGQHARSSSNVFRILSQYWSFSSYAWCFSG